MSRVAVVTGAARGIGAATVDALAGGGWRVVAVDACADDPVLGYPLGTREELDALAARHEGSVLAVVGDVRSRPDMERSVAAALERFGRVDAAVAAAGVIAGGQPIWETSDAAWDAMFAVNVDGARHLAAAVVPALLSAPEPRQGRVVVVASTAGLLGLYHLTAYGAAKHAAVGLVRGLAADLVGTGVTANAVCPGSTRTAILAESARLYDLASPESFASQQLLGRLLEPEEPAAMVAWLCSEAASGVTGAILPVDAGMTTS